MTRPGLSVVAALIALAAAACSDDTGILVEVHGEELGVPVARLDTVVLLSDGVTPPSSEAWGAAPPFASEVNADLAVDPYTVMLEPEGVSNQQRLHVAAIAYDGAGAVIGFGQLDGSVAFSADVVKRVALYLRPATTQSDCIIKGEVVLVRYTDDCDGDQAAYWEDCDDLDAGIVADIDDDPAVCFDDCAPGDGAVFPGNDEVCDGKDNDCDEATQPEPKLCATVAFSEEQTLVECRLGQAECLEADGSAEYDCGTLPIDPNRYVDACNRWAICNKAGAGPECLVDARYDCELPSEGAGTACLPAVFPLHEVTGGLEECGWQLVGNVQQAGWDVGLRAADTDGAPQTLVETCDAELVVTGTGALPRIIVIEQLTIEGSFLYSFLLHPELASCSDEPPERMDCDPIDGL